MSVHYEKKEWNSLFLFLSSLVFAWLSWEAAYLCFPLSHGLFHDLRHVGLFFLSLSAFAIEETLPLSPDGWGRGLVWSVKSINVNIHQAFSLHLFLQCKTDSLGMQCHINLTTGWLKCPTEASKRFSPGALSLPYPLLEENNGARLKQGLAFYRRSAKAHSPKSERERGVRGKCWAYVGKNAEIFSG